MAHETVVQGERLRDQIYRLLREDIKSGALQPGQRIVEGEMAERYKVSRTPIREALFQLARDGMLTPSADRGYVVAIDSPRATEFRHEVRALLEPRLAYHAALEGTPEACKALQKAYDAQVSAHAKGQVEAFLSTNAAFRDALRSMCGNRLLNQCSAVIDDLAQSARRYALTYDKHRELELHHDGQILAAVLAKDGPAAEAAMHDYVKMVRERSQQP